MFWRKRERSVTDLDQPEPVAAPVSSGPCEVVLESTGPKKIQVIKAIREATRLGLKEAKDLADAADAAPTSLGSFSEEVAAALRADLEAAGASVSTGAGTAPAESADDTVSLLERLASLHDRGALTDAEFAEQKRRILEGG